MSNDFNCTTCSYTSSRKYNIERYMLKTHNMVYITSQIAFCKNSQNVINNLQNVTETLQKGIRCYNCYK